ncbi:squalene-hopene/tetraprenyl-beta-curcumene cyclase [Granulicella rosea]|uniref:Squalene-hopene/tetraprenyl-beta-curcumene cyclase n=1 Tax=Granulicella rosea TaxID=474952 RepID=A0A239JA63_9BACT|nr:squalene--hopene cyclase [Granulicella rosea]SNT02143.1 squalene-hopene/tetraprenyl-beta-curcumene cyclase [Granulicella rosea]
MSAVPINSNKAAGSSQPRFGRMDLGLDHVAGAVKRATDWLMGQQHADGYWCGELEADVMLEADYIFMHVLLGTGDPGKMERAINEILRHQNEDGGWGHYPGGPSNINYGVKSYLALKLMGWSANHPVLVKARQWVLANGGVVECNTFTKIYLCAMGQYDYDAVPAVPPEIILFPDWFYFNIYEISAWSRAILVPLSIIYAKKPFRKLLPEQSIEELFVGGRENSDLHLRWDRKHPISWRNFFLFTDRVAHWAERVHIRPLRKKALKKAEQWMLDHFERSDGLGAIYPAMLNAIVALVYLGYSKDDPQVIRAMDEFEKLGIDCPNGTPDYPTPTFRMQPCFSPVWDTAQVLSTLGEAGLSRTDPRLVKAADWLLSKEIRYKGDWSHNVKNVEASCWCFFFNNDHQPDVDDTGEVLLALKAVDNPRERYQHEVSQRAIEWVFAMQCRNGGWASFDKDNTKKIFESIPFADHNAMIDPPTVDITGRILEMLAQYGYTRKDARVEKAIQFILKEQEPDGSWFGRWGVNYLYGTFLVLRGLEAMGFWNHEPAIQNAAEWIRMVQNADGGWGETCGTYDDPNQRGVGPSTPSQTAWALLGLLAAGDTRSDSVAKGVRWLVERQHEDGSWDELVPGRNGESYYTGTGFPRVFYLGYHLYKQYFPLLALTTYSRAMGKSE